MSELSQLSPQPLWDIFAKICSIPHPSYHEEQLAEYIVGWAKEKGFHVERDQVGNILIRKPATAGMENRKPVVLQAHLDMVPQKNNDTVHDFTKDPIQPYIDGEWVKARGTTLGADNGIGMASALAVLADENVVHGPLEVLLTMTEEAGMDGAFGLQSNWLQADILINTDSEEEGEIYMGCAGGIDFTSNLHLDREAVPAGFETFKLTLKGLKGGHSGGEIHVGLGNANKLLVRFLAGHAEELDLRLIDFNGGTLRNAIPREAFATIAVAADKVDALKSLVDTYQEILKNELAEKEKNLALLLDSVANDKAALIAKSRDTFIRLLNATPNGVIRNSDVAKGVVETSLNVGVVTMTDNNVEIHCLIRSLIDSGKDYVVSMLDSLGKQILPDWLTIEEHPHLLKGLASTPFDSEGVRTERRDIVKDGILTQWLLTSYSARKLGLKSTGHAGGIHNWRIAGQGLSFEQMLKEMGTGLVVTELMGQGVSAITGDYSRGAAGFWVENGEIQYPVSEITIAGNLKDMWRNIVTVGNDIETRSNIQCGSVLLPEMKIAGQ